jgi:hypothetical protein
MQSFGPALANANGLTNIDGKSKLSPADNLVFGGVFFYSSLQLLAQLPWPICQKVMAKFSGIVHIYGCSMKVLTVPSGLRTRRN